MKISTNRNCCKVVFEENDKYSGKTLLIDGEGDLKREFGIYKSHVHQMCWKDSLDVGKNGFVYVDSNLQDEVLSYVIEEAKKIGFSLVLW